VPDILFANRKLVPDFDLPGLSSIFSTFINVKKRAHKHNLHERRGREAILLLGFVSRVKSAWEIGARLTFLRMEIGARL
jgi:hypothetical protein